MISVKLFIISSRLSVIFSKMFLVAYMAAEMSLHDVGIYGAVVGITAIVPTLTGVGIISYVGRGAVLSPFKNTSRELSNYFILLFIFYVIISVIIMLLIGSGYLNSLIILAVFVVALEHFTQDTYNLLNSFQMPIRANAISAISRGAWPIIFVSISIFDEKFKTVEALLLVWASVSLLSFLCARPVFAYIRFGELYSISQLSIWLKSSALRSIYLYIGSACNAVSLFSDRFAVTLNIGFHEAGVYTFFWQFSSAIYGLVNSGTMQIYRPRLVSLYWSDDITGFNNAYRKCCLISLLEYTILSLLVVIFLPYILVVIERKELLDNKNVLYLLLFSAFVRVWADLENYKLYASGNDKFSMYGYIFILITSLPLYYILSFVSIYAVAISINFIYLGALYYRRILAKHSSSASCLIG